MSSENKKKKAKNSFIYNAEKDDTKLRRINYYKKKDRNRLNKYTKHIIIEEREDGTASGAIYFQEVED